MNKYNFIADTAEFVTTDSAELTAFLEEREANSIWLTDNDGVSADTTRFQPIFAEPICVPAAVDKLKQSTTVKFTASEEAYADTMYAPDNGYEGSSQMVFVKGRLAPMGMSAVKGAIDRAGLKTEGYEKLKKFSPQSLADVLNLCMQASSGGLCVLIQDEKVRAINSGRYAICPATYVLQTMQDWVNAERPQAKFVKAYANHDVMTWSLDLSAYTSEVLGSFPALATCGFEPALTIRLSHTGNSSVSLQPSLMRDGIVFPIGEPINCPHIGSGSADERTLQVEAAVKENFNQIFPSLEKSAKAIEKLDSITIKNAHSALIGAMKALKLPRAQAAEVAEQFEQIYPDAATAYDLYGAVLDVFSLFVAENPKDERKMLDVAEAVKRASVLKWTDYDIPGVTW